MGCICSKRTADEDVGGYNENQSKEKESTFTPHRSDHHSSVQLVAPSSKQELLSDADVRKKVGNVHRSESFSGNSAQYSRLASILRGPPQAENISVGWPQWLSSAAPDVVVGWLPRRADSFEKLEKIGQGTYSTVYKAHDLKTGKTVAMKKVRFVNMDVDSVRFMAREINILRKLDHPNVMKLESIVASRLSDSLYLVFEYMEHDLAGLAAAPSIKFTEPQIKCYMRQLLSGLEHCHNSGILHRDIKGSNLLIDNNGVLKIGDFGLATFYQPDQKQALTSRVVTLWYRAPELLLGAAEYGIAIDMWSAGCILAELYAGKPIMLGRTEVEQLHKILKLCGSPSEDYWEKTKFSHATSFKPQQNYKRRVAETFKSFSPTALALVDRLLSIEPEARGSATTALQSEFFKTDPLPCDPSCLPRYPPSKELDIRIREEESRRRKDAVRGCGPESVRRGSRDSTTSPEFIPQGEAKSVCKSYRYDPQEDTGTGFPIEPPKGMKKNGLSHSTSMVQPSTSGGTSSNKNVSSTHCAEYMTQQKLHKSRATADTSTSLVNKEEKVYVPRKNRIHYSGPLMPPGGNIEDLLREHDKHIQQAVRKARLEKSESKSNLRGSFPQHHCGRYGG